ncbi:GLI pathogenesis-related 2, like isoform X3 [Phycodurus eques]|uniref:GLI pathogenesis-related 2, like isoform X3 n=1 Tax=Phycodurus eques TaxID=693459 RepID=UPI002ACE0DFC|nr:GLI pathogenesis-related 2, like isoform X3 [Phycodurus eques]XP_061530868.1 GLI pathogenesis-related 2, like isoform X3 [Phycodurus eques]
MGKSASKQFAEEVLQCHNEYRKKHQAPALKLNSKLSREAARYAESLASTRILKHSEESSRGSCGENLAWASYDQSGKDVADRWYDEVKQYNFNSPGFSSGTGTNHGSIAPSACRCPAVKPTRLPLLHDANTTKED